MKTTESDQTPIIHANDIASTAYHGIFEAGEDYWTLVTINLHNGQQYVVAGGACNAGLMPEYAASVESYCSECEALQEICADLTEIAGDGYPSGELLSWHGSLVI